MPIESPKIKEGYTLCTRLAFGHDAVLPMEVVPKGGVPGSIDPRRIERGQAMRASQNRVARAYNKKVRAKDFSFSFRRRVGGVTRLDRESKVEARLKR